MNRLWIIFCLLQYSVFSQAGKTEPYIYIELQGGDVVYHQYYFYCGKDSAQYSMSQSGHDFVRKVKMAPEVSQTILKEAIRCIENVNIDSTKETGLYLDHYFRIAVSYNSQWKSVYMGDKHYYLLLEELFKTINARMDSSIRIPLQAIAFSSKPRNPKLSDPHFYMFYVDWHSSFGHPGNRYVEHLTTYGDSVRVSPAGKPLKKAFIGAARLKRLQDLTLACTNGFKFAAGTVKQPASPEIVGVFNSSQRVEIITQFSSFELADKNALFMKLKKYINKEILAATPLE